jgi:hypothetical protein
MVFQNRKTGESGNQRDGPYCLTLNILAGHPNCRRTQPKRHGGTAFETLMGLPLLFQSKPMKGDQPLILRLRESCVNSD